MSSNYDDEHFINGVKLLIAIPTHVNNDDNHIKINEYQAADDTFTATIFYFDINRIDINNVEDEMETIFPTIFGNTLALDVSSIEYNSSACKYANCKFFIALVSFFGLLCVI